MDKYLGYDELTFTDEELSDIYSNGKCGRSLKENQYVLSMQDGICVDKFCMQNGTLRRVKYTNIENDYIGTVKPRNLQQCLAFDLLQDPSTKVKVLQGVYGSGKDFVMLTHALNLIDKGKFNKIVFIRPNVTVKDVPDIGFLPGTIDEKLKWTLGPIYDKVGGADGINHLVESNQLEIVPLVFIRGRSFENSIIYVTEGQNMTREIAKLIIGRVGEGSELWINADTHQTDREKFDKDNGIKAMIDKLAGDSLFGYIYLPITERSAVANLANKLDE